MKQVFPVLELSAIIAACSSKPQEAQGHSTQQEIPITVPLGSLVTHPGSGSLYTRSHAEGIIDLHYLAMTAENEDAWLWTGTSWLDVGTEESPATVTLDIDLILRTVAGLQQGATVYDYHIHPEVQHPHPPSILDFQSYGYLNRRLSEQNARSRSFVLDGHGLWEYTVAENAEYAKCYYSIIANEENMFEPVLITKEKINTFIAEMNKCGISLKYYSIE